MSKKLPPQMALPAMPEFFDPALLPPVDGQSVPPWQPAPPLPIPEAAPQVPAVGGPTPGGFGGPPAPLWPSPAERQASLADAKQRATPQLPPNPTAYEVIDQIRPFDIADYGTQWLGDKFATGVENLIEPPANSYEMVKGKPQYLTKDKIFAEQQKAKAEQAAKATLDKTLRPAFDNALGLTPQQQQAEGTAVGEKVAEDVANYGTTYQDEYVDAATRLGAETAAQGLIMDALQERGIKDLQSASDNIRATFMKADMDLAKLKIDPNRWEKETPAMTQALMLIAAGAFGFITKGRSANPILGIMDRAIQKDVDAQMTNYQLAMERNKLKVKNAYDEAYARQQLRTAMWNRAAHQMGMIEQNGKTELAILNAKAAREQFMMQLGVEHEKRYRAAVDKYNNEGSAQAEQDFSQAVGGIKDIETLKHFMNKMPEGKIGRALSWAFGHIPGVTTSTEMYDIQKTALGRLLAKASLGGNLSDVEGQAFIDKLPLKMMNQQQQAEALLAVSTKIRSNMKTQWERLSPNRRATLAKQYESALNDLNAFESSLAQWAHKK